MKSHALLGLVLLVAACSPPASNGTRSEPRATSIAGPQPIEVARGLEVPWSIAFADDGRIFVTERPGRVRVIVDGKLQPEPIHTFPNISTRSEEGLMGLALHPNYFRNHFMYLSYATERGGRMVVDVVRCTENGNLTGCLPIVTGIPAAKYHAGSRLKFGPDMKLYITTGDATDRQLAQDMDSLAGKILRVNEDATPPINNPFRPSPVWSSGHRNAQGIDWDPVSGMLFSTEHGPSGFDGPRGGDEVNIIERGANYGWPVVHHDENRAPFIAPLRVLPPTCAPASAAFWRGDFYFGCLRGEHLHKLVLDPTDRRKILREEKLYEHLGRIREVAAGRDGALYFSTSNRDGRGDAAAEDDRIFKVMPP